METDISLRRVGPDQIEGGWAARNTLRVTLAADHLNRA